MEILSKLFLSIVVLLMTIMLGCSDNLLNQEPQSSYSSDNVWSDLTLTKTYVNELYQVLPQLEGDQGDDGNFNLASISGDAYVRFNYAHANVIQQGVLSPDNTTRFGNVDLGWDKYWNTIRSCNIFLNKIHGVPGNATVKKHLTGQVHFLRAWSYFELIKRYGGVPIIKKVFKLGGNYKTKRSSYDACTKFIVADLDTAATDLPASYSSSDLGRATKGAALGLKSRVLLFDASALNNPEKDMSKWKKAAKAAKAVIDMDVYQLYQGSNYANLFLKNWTSGIIFAKNGSTNPQFSSPTKFQTMEAPNGFHGWSTHSPSQNLVNAFLMKNGKSIGAPGSGYDSQHPYKNRGPRFYADIVYNQSLLYGRHIEFYKGGKSSQQGIDNWNASLTGYTLKKFFDQSNPISSAKRSNIGLPLIRLAGIYLNYAESEYHLGNEDMARHYLNLLRKMPSISLPDLPKSLSGPDLLAAVRRARRIDLCFEGHHYWDLLRWKRAMKELNGSLMGVSIIKNSNGTFKYSYKQVIPLTFKKRMYRFPLPREVMNKSDLKQNPSY
jgi:hypothetical protein